jgi:chromosome segregation ATPase
VLKIYSMKEIVDASNKILESEDNNNDLVIKPINNAKEKYLSEKSLPKDIESIISKAENLQIHSKENNSTNISNHEEKNSSEEFKVSRDELVESMYKTFSKKIKKNTLKLILELREEVIFSTKKISSLKKLKKLEQDSIKILKKDIIDLEQIQNQIKDNFEKSQNDFIFLKKQHEDLNKEHDSLKEQYENLNLQYNSLKMEHKNSNIENVSLKNNLSDLNNILTQLRNETITLKNDNIKINAQLNDYRKKEIETKSKIKENEEISLVIKSLEINNHETKNTLSIYARKNEELQNEINELKTEPINVEDNNYLADIKELKNKVKHYQDENIRISNEFVESNKKFEITKESLNELQNHRSGLIEKINSINEVIKNENIVTSVFHSDLEKDKIKVVDSNKPAKTNKNDLDEKIKNIFIKD